MRVCCRHFGTPHKGAQKVQYLVVMTNGKAWVYSSTHSIMMDRFATVCFRNTCRQKAKHENIVHIFSWTTTFCKFEPHMLLLYVFDAEFSLMICIVCNVLFC